jgi:hypothetical protein
VTKPSIVSAPSMAAAASIQPCESNSSRRRSTISASAPAGSAKSRIGRLDAVWISATISGEADNEVISQAAPTFCIQVPMLETREATESARNMRCASGRQIAYVPRK